MVIMCSAGALVTIAIWPGCVSVVMDQLLPTLSDSGREFHRMFMVSGELRKSVHSSKNLEEAEVEQLGISMRISTVVRVLGMGDWAWLWSSKACGQVLPGQQGWDTTSIRVHLILYVQNFWMCVCVVVEESAPNYATHLERGLSTFFPWERQLSVSHVALGTSQWNSAESKTVLSNSVLSATKHPLNTQDRKRLWRTKALLKNWLYLVAPMVHLNIKTDKMRENVYL